MDLEDLEYSLTGNSIRRFKLVDGAGSFFQCAAMAQNTKRVALRKNFKVVVYYGTGRGPIGTIGGALYLMKDAAIVAIA